MNEIEVRVDPLVIEKIRKDPKVINLVRLFVERATNNSNKVSIEGDNLIDLYSYFLNTYSNETENVKDILKSKGDGPFNKELYLQINKARRDVLMPLIIKAGFLSDPEEKK